jgi:hypothetical protein
MKTQEYLDSLKSEYEKTEATLHLKESGWGELSRQMDPFRPLRHSWLRNLSIVLAVFVIFLLGTYKIALAALPGDILYPVKLLSEKIIQEASGSNQIVIDHRASEIVGLSKEQETNSQDLEQVVTEYTENVDQAKQDLELSGKPSINFQTKLDEQHSEFERIGQEHPEIEDEIQDAKDASDREEHELDD